MTYMIYYEMSDKDWSQGKPTHDFAHTLTRLEKTLKWTNRKVTKILKLYSNGKGVDISDRYLKQRNS